MVYLVILVVVGFINAYFLHWQYLRFKRTKRPMFCLIGKDCAGVIDSRFGTTAGVKNEIMGMIYYSLLLLALLLSNYFATNLVNIVIFLATLVAALFSLYLLYVQAIVLKKLCSWCLIAIALNIIIFVLAAKLFI